MALAKLPSFSPRTTALVGERGGYCLCFGISSLILLCLFLIQPGIRELRSS